MPQNITARITEDEFISTFNKTEDSGLFKVPKYQLVRTDTPKLVTLVQL